MNIRPLREDEKQVYIKRGVDSIPEFKIEDGAYSIEVDARTASWIARAIEFGRSSAKQELREWLNTSWKKVT